ncbi:MAG: hypothetical protein ACHP7J_00015 [Terriglobales bacterium]
MKAPTKQQSLSPRMCKGKFRASWSLTTSRGLSFPFASARYRCTNVNSPDYPDYSGSGVKVCERWLVFENFLADMGPRPSPQHSLDRFPNQNGDYEPGNCRWATIKEQNRNRKSNRPLTLNGETKLIIEWSELLGMSKNTIRARLERGWSVERTLTTPVQ